MHNPLILLTTLIPVDGISTTSVPVDPFFFGWFEKAARAHPGISFQNVSITPESAITITLESLLQRTISGVQGLPPSLKPVLVIEDFGLLQPKLQSDYLDALPGSPFLQNPGAVLFLLSSGGEPDFKKMTPQVLSIKMPPFNKKIIREILESPKIPPGDDLENLAGKLYDRIQGSPEKVYEIVELLKQ